MTDFSRTDFHPGAVLLRHFLGRDEQVELLDRCRVLGDNPAGFYRPTHRSGGQMTVAMMCLGLHWNARTYAYEATRSDHDGLPAQPLPPGFMALCQRAAAAADMSMVPDICLVNRYEGDARLGLHRDTDERPETRAAGIPIVSVSLGDSAEYLLGGLKRSDVLETIELRSGDVIVLGGPSRMRYHGVAKILPGTTPLGAPGRINLTFRQY